MSGVSKVIVTDATHWPRQRAALEEVRECRTIAALVAILKRTSHQFEETQYEGGAFAGVEDLSEAFDDEDWWTLVSYMADLALRSTTLFEADGARPLSFLPPAVASSVSYTRLQAASLLALGFFDALPSAPADADWEMPDHLSFRFWLSGASIGEADSHKAHCLLQYFMRHRHLEETAAHGADSADDLITITRLVLPAERGLHLHDWTACATPLQRFVVERSRSVGIEDAKGALQADFANEYIGGGVMCGGNVQEEIRFSICPECLVANLLCPRMNDNEALLLSGIRQYAPAPHGRTSRAGTRLAPPHLARMRRHSCSVRPPTTAPFAACRYASFAGYGGSFECTGAHPDPAASTAHVLAIDARPYLGEARKQYRQREMLRELTKLWVGLSDEAWPSTEAAAAPAKAAAQAKADAAATVTKAGKRTRQQASTVESAATAASSATSSADVGASSPTIAASVAGLPFATGNWGCGVFGGDLRLKALLQWLAASRAGRTTLYFPYGDGRATGLAEVADKLVAAGTTVGQLATALLESDAEALSDGGAFELVLASLKK